MAKSEKKAAHFRGRSPHKPTRKHKNPRAYSRRRDKRGIEREGKKG